MTNNDIEYMKYALQLAEKGRLSAPPNPWVGCVIIKNEEMLGQGYHNRPGEPHAEIMAIRSSNKELVGSDVYVTLEPCSHHGRTPPCAEALINIRPRRIIIGLLDPDPKVSGKGIKQLKEAGIQVEHGVLEQSIKDSLAPYLHHRKTSMPFVVIKAAMSIDGCIASHEGTSQWITSSEARDEAHLIRACSQAVLVGINTVLKDNPQLTCRRKDLPIFTQPLRVVLDPHGRLPAEGNLFNMKLAPTLIITTKMTPSPIQDAWREKGAEVFCGDYTNEGFDLRALLKFLGERGIIQVMVEGGASVISSFFKAKLVNRLVTCYGPHLLGANGLHLVDSTTFFPLIPAPFHLRSCEMMGNSLKAEWEFLQTSF